MDKKTTDKKRRISVITLTVISTNPLFRILHYDAGMLHHMLASAVITITIVIAITCLRFLLTPNKVIISPARQIHINMLMNDILISFIIQYIYMFCQ